MFNEKIFLENTENFRAGGQCEELLKRYKELPGIVDDVKLHCLVNPQYNVGILTKSAMFISKNTAIKRSQRKAIDNSKKGFYITTSQMKKMIQAFFGKYQECTLGWSMLPP